MSLSIAIVGLPNVGKSTLFNALLKRQQALAANYPFATIEPNIGIVPVPDVRLEKLASVVNTTVIKPATVEFVDVAGLVKGASEGEGLGNKFLANIRETSAICHVIRAFEDEKIIREGSVSPKDDLEIIRTELQLADLATLEKQTRPKGAVSSEEKERWEVIEQFKQWLEVGETIISNIQSPISKNIAKELCLLTAKPELFIINVSEEDLQSGVEDLQNKFASELEINSKAIIVMSNQIESELSSLADEDQTAYLQDLGLEKSGLERLIQSAYSTLGLQSFLTAGEKEVRAWTIATGSSAVEAAAVIHTDFAKKFIKAKVASYTDFIKLGGWKGVSEVGKLRQEGRDYVMQEGDVVEFAIGA
ncbi:MAG: redox-regulated ATPase YchF [Patescibacteria group bacterium]